MATDRVRPDAAGFAAGRSTRDRHDQPGFRNPQAVGDPQQNPVIDVDPFAAGEAEMKADARRHVEQLLADMGHPFITASEQQIIDVSITAGMLAALGWANRQDRS